MQKTGLLPPSALLLAAFLFGTVALVAAGPRYESQAKTVQAVPEASSDITKALHLIVETLQINQKHSHLYDRVALLEASLALSTEQNSLMEKRFKTLEGQIPAMGAQIEDFSKVVEKVQSLEAERHDLMERFEDKLTTMAAEVLRLKGRFGRPRGAPGFIARNDVMPVELGRKNTIRRCSSLSATASNAEKLGCLFTPEGVSLNWTAAHLLCAEKNSDLAAFSLLPSIQTQNGTKSRFWVSGDSLLDFSDIQLLEFQGKDDSDEKRDLGGLYDTRPNVDTDLVLVEWESRDLEEGEHLGERLKETLGLKTDAKDKISGRRCPTAECGAEGCVLALSLCSEIKEFWCQLRK